jgi:hypothetical protein
VQRKTDTKGSIAPEVRLERQTEGHFLQNPLAAAGPLMKNPLALAKSVRKWQPSPFTQ